ncbi:MAG: DUF882 domain-containing protein [Hyphomicrobium sp.]
MLRPRSLLAILLAAGAIALTGGRALIAAPEPPREISFFHIHTKETLTIVYKVDGKYVPEAMDKIDWLMRDWRQNKAIKMDPKTIDILWEMHTELGSKEPIHIICGYRSGATNAMLRRTVGGQAKNSNHITGLAIDAYFPDVPPKFARYAALVRERGGVGYYPTSALPFVHVDTGRVRHWPKIAHDELALLFPNDRSKHVPLGGALRSGDHARAKQRNAALATQVATYVDLRTAPKQPTLIAANLPVAPAPKPALRPQKAATPAPRPEPVVASLTPPAAPAPKLVSAPRLVERPSRFTPRPSDGDRAQLNQLVTLAALQPTLPPPKLVAAPAPAVRPPKSAVTGPEAAATSQVPQVATEDQGLGITDLITQWAQSWVQSPAYDEDHPEELSYLPFPLGPVMTETSSPDDPLLAQFVPPDIAKTLEILDDDGGVQPMRLRPQLQVAQLLWSQQFRGDAVQPSNAAEPADAGNPVPPGLAERSVKTTVR